MFGLVLWHIDHCRSFNAKSLVWIQFFVYTQLNVKTVLFQTIQISLSIKFFVYTQLDDQTVLFQTIQFSMTTKLNDSKYCYVSLTIQLNISHFVYKQLNNQKVLFQTIRFSISKQFFVYTESNVIIIISCFRISTQFSSTWLIDRTLSGATTPGLSWPGSNGNEGVLCIPQSSRPHYWSLTIILFSVISRTLIGRESYSSSEMQSVYSAAPADRVKMIDFKVTIPIY